MTWTDLNGGGVIGLTFQEMQRNGEGGELKKGQKMGSFERKRYEGQ